MELVKIEIDQFECRSGKLMISDPCYKIGTWCQGVFNNVLTGKWNGWVYKTDDGDLGERCAEIHAYHESIKNPDSLDRIWVANGDFVVGVDSGQAGIFDFATFRDNALANEPGPESLIQDPDDKWYSNCCDATLSEVGAGKVNEGVVSSSGYGDGSYEASYVCNNSGYIVAVKIVFIKKQQEYPHLL